MVYRMTVILTDAEYKAFSAEAAKRGTQLEKLLHEVLVQHIPSTPLSTPSTSREDIQAYLFHKGLITHIPSNQLDTREEGTERNSLAHLFSQGKSASEMIIEDRGPY